MNACGLGKFLQWNHHTQKKKQNKKQTTLKMGPISNYLYGNEDNVFWKTMLDDSKSGYNVDTDLVLKMHMKNLNKIISLSARLRKKNF